MSYDLGLKLGEEWAELDHNMQGGTYPLGGSRTATLNVTYNYAPHFARVLGPGGIRSLYGKTGEESIPLLAAGIAQLGGDVDDDYWKPTEGNARAALLNLLTLAAACPTGVWAGD